jgi:hypothetical protein
MKESHDWSLLVGKQASEVESTIRQMRPDLNVHVLKEVCDAAATAADDDYDDYDDYDDDDDSI